jgi:hypothetical protein
MTEPKKRKGRKPAGGGSKRQFLATMEPELIKAIKTAAIQDEISASEILEEAARGWLEQRKSQNADQ